MHRLPYMVHTLLISGEREREREREREGGGGGREMYLRVSTLK